MCSLATERPGFGSLLRGRSALSLRFNDAFLNRNPL
jgi:hypothetical protein